MLEGRTSGLDDGRVGIGAEQEDRVEAGQRLIPSETGVLPATERFAV